MNHEEILQLFEKSKSTPAKVIHAAALHVPNTARSMLKNAQRPKYAGAKIFLNTVIRFFPLPAFKIQRKQTFFHCEIKKILTFSFIYRTTAIPVIHNTGGKSHPLGIQSDPRSRSREIVCLCILITLEGYHEKIGDNN